MDSGRSFSVISLLRPGLLHVPGYFPVLLYFRIVIVGKNSFCCLGKPANVFVKELIVFVDKETDEIWNSLFSLA